VSIRENTAIKKAAVLPVPVWAWAAMSLPLSASGRVRACTGVHSANPAALIPLRTSSGISSSSNLTSLIYYTSRKVDPFFVFLLVE
jgi:hypothetical protein